MISLCKSFSSGKKTRLFTIIEDNLRCSGVSKGCLPLQGFLITQEGAGKGVGGGA